MKKRYILLFLILITIIVALSLKIWGDDEEELAPTIIINVSPPIEADTDVLTKGESLFEFPVQPKPMDISQEIEESATIDRHNSFDSVNANDISEVILWRGITTGEDLFSLIMSSPDPHIVPLVKASEIFDRCHNKSRGGRYIATVDITLENEGGVIRTSKYVQLWKTMDMENDLPYRTMMYTQHPIDALGTAFMRWHYSPDKGKLADQWLYLPLLGKIRKLTIRDLSDNFLSSDLIYWDVEEHSLEEDSYRLIKSSILPNGQYGYVVEVKPKEDGQPYSKTIYSFVRDEVWLSCHTGNVRFYDWEEELQKIQNIEWQMVGAAWLWERMLINNVQTKHSTLIRLTDVDVNVDLPDLVFSKKKMKDSNKWLQR